MNLTASLQQSWQLLLAKGTQQCGALRLEATTRGILSRSRVPGTTLYLEQELRLLGDGNLRYSQLQTDGKGYIAPDASTTVVSVEHAAALLRNWIRNMQTLHQLAVPRDDTSA